MKKIILSTILLAAALTTTAQDKLIRVADKPTSWRKEKPKKTLFDSEMARLLIPQGATFGVECIPSFSPEWTLTYDSVARSLVYREAQTSIWHTTFQATHKEKKIGEKRYKWVPRKHPKDYVAPNVKTFTLPVSDDQTAILRDVWKTAVYGAEDREVFILDGVKWEFFIDGRRAKSHHDKNVLVAFTEKLRQAVRSGDTNRKDSLIGNEFQRVVDGLTIVPPPEVLPPGTVRKLIVWNGEVLNDSLAKFRTYGTIGSDEKVYFYRRHQIIKSISFHYNEEEKREFAERYGITAKDLVMEFKTVPDTLCDAYVRQHPELKQTRRYIEGYILNEDDKPLADAWIGWDTSFMGTATDSTGHFVMWLPRTVTKLNVEHVGFHTIRHQIQPDDTVLNFRMKDATKIKEEKVLRKEE